LTQHWFAVAREVPIDASLLGKRYLHCLGLSVEP